MTGAQITIKDTETVSLEELDALLEEARERKRDWYVSGWENFARGADLCGDDRGYERSGRQ